MKAPFILLINPWIYDFSAYDLWIKPLGLLCIAGILKKNGFGVHVIDCLDIHHPDMQQNPAVRQPFRREMGQGHFYQQKIPKPACLKNIPRNYRRYGLAPSIFEKELRAAPKPQAVLVTSMMTYWYPGVYDCIQTIKAVYPDVPVVLGGIYATLCLEHARAHSGADTVFAGLCSKGLARILEKATGKTVHISGDDFFPQPDCAFLSSKKSIPILSSQGCPFRCTYCASGLLYPGFRQKRPAKIADYIERWQSRGGTTDFVFYDDALLINPEQHIIPLLREVVKRNISARFHVPNGLHVRGIDHRVAELMMKAGFKTLRLGLETADPQLQKETGDKVTQQDFIRAATALKDAGFSAREAGVYILAGLPQQHFQSVYDTVKFVQDHGLRPLIAEYSPIPGTILWDRAVACSPFPIADEPLFHNNTLLPCQWEKFTVEDLNFLKLESRKQ